MDPRQLLLSWFDTAANGVTMLLDYLLHLHQPILLLMGFLAPQTEAGQI
jgi:hypothetical protein